MRTLFLGLTLALLAVASSATPAQTPWFQAQTLVVPRVDTMEQLGMYQDVVMQLDAHGVWRIVSMQTLGQGTLQPLGIGDVSVVKTAGLPASVFLRLSGGGTFCGAVGPARVHQRRSDTHFDIHVTADRALRDPWIPCAQIVQPFKLTLALEVYGLPTGTYTYRVNGSLSGSFSFERNNQFEDDCLLDRVGQCRR